MKVQELESYKEQYRKSQDEVKSLKAKVYVHCSPGYCFLDSDSG